MKLVVSGAAVLAVLAALAKAEPQYDRKLERAVMEIVARRIGDIPGGIRGGFEHGRDPEFVVIHNPASEEDVWRGMLHTTRPIRESDEIPMRDLNLRITSF